MLSSRRRGKLVLLWAEWRREQRAMEQAMLQVEEERRLKEAAEATNKKNLDALRHRIETDFQRHKDDIQRLEQDLSRLKASNELPEGDGARMLHDFDSLDVSRDRECIICMKAEVSVVFLPCAHQEDRLCNIFTEKEDKSPRGWKMRTDADTGGKLSGKGEDEGASEIKPNLNSGSTKRWRKILARKRDVEMGESGGTMATTNLDATFDHITDNIEDMKWHVKGYASWYPHLSQQIQTLRSKHLALLVHVDDERVTNKPLSVSSSLPTYEYIDSLPLVDNVNVVRVDTLVDPIDDRIDSSSMIDLCPPSVEAIVLNESTSSYENCVDQLVCKNCPPLENMCDVINESQVSEEFENVGQEKRSEPVSLCCCKDSNVCLAHRVNRVLDISLELDNDSLESESSKSVRGLDHSLFRYNVLFEDSLNTPNRPSGENDGIACLRSYSIYANPLWCDNIPPKDGNLFLEDEITLKGKEYVVLETTSSSTLCGFSEDTIVDVELSATFLYSLSLLVMICMPM
ncbi:MND1-interacting protein 1 [Capsicum chinense]|nr:MND1-interacting protein 1 [Capsicum chinense]